MSDTSTEPTPDEGEAVGPPEGLELHANGTITVHLGDARLKLRRPKAGEYRKLREAYEALVDQVTEASEEAAAQMDPIRQRAAAAAEADPSARLSAEDRALDRKLSRELVAFGDRLRVGWVVLAFTGQDPEHLTPEALAGLADRAGALPADPDEWPIWLSRGETIQALFKQWQSVPSPRGVR